MLSLFIVDLHVAVNNIKPLCFATETQEWVPFAPLSGYQVFCVANNNINVVRFLCKVADIVVR
jgi:hypothetical protein